MLSSKKHTQIDNQKIVEAIKSGDDNKALKALYKFVLPTIISYIRKKGGRLEDAEDVFQDAVVILFRKIKTNKFDTEESVIGGFLFTICKNLWINKVKKESRIRPLEMEDSFENNDTSVLDDLISVERSEIIASLMNDIGEQCKEILKLAIYERKTMNEIAAIMNFKSKDVAKSVHYRCKKKLGQMANNNPIYLSTLSEK